MTRSAVFCGFVTFGLGGCSSRVPSIKVASETVVQACADGFDYSGYLANAERGDTEAIAALLRFSEHTDAAGGLGHGVVLVELFAMNGDAKMASGIDAQPEPVRSSVLRSLEAGEAYTNPNPARPLREVYPASVAALISQRSSTQGDSRLNPAGSNLASIGYHAPSRTSARTEVSGTSF